MNTEIKKEQSFIFLIIVWLVFGWFNMQSMLAMTSSLALARAQKKLAPSMQIEMPEAAQKQWENISSSSSDEQKKELLRKLLRTMPEGQIRWLTGDKVIGILRPSGQAEQVIEQPIMHENIGKSEKQLTDLERQLGSPSENLRVIKKSDELTEQIEQQGNVQRFEVERYLNMLENALQRESVDAQMIRNIRISIDEIVGNTKRLPANQREMMEKRIAYLETQLTGKLFDFLEQLERDTKAMGARSDVTLAEIEKMFALLDQIKAVRSNFTLPEDQAKNIEERIADVADSLNDERNFLHRKELSEQRHAALQVIREQEELQKKKEQEQKRELIAQEERRVAQSSTVSIEPQETIETVQLVQKPEAKVDEKLEEKRIVSLLRWKMKGLSEAFNLAYQIWFDRQLEEDALRTSCMRLSRRTTDKEKLVLQSLAAHLESSKNNINLLAARVGTIDQAVDQLFKQPEHKQSDLVELMQYWQTVLRSIEELSEKTHRALFDQNQQKKREGKATSLAFIKRNDDVMKVIAKLLGRISIIKIANRNKTEQLSKPLPVAQKEQCISRRSRRKGAFSRYF